MPSYILKEKPYETRWAKTVWNRLYILLTWLLWLFGLNYLMLVEIDSIAVLLTLIAWAACYLYVRKVQNVRYRFDTKGIDIHTASKKNYHIPRSDIQERKQENLTTYTIFLPKIISKTINYATSTRHLIRISTHDQVDIYISPRRVPQIMKTTEN